MDPASMPRPSLRLAVEIDRTPAGRLEGRVGTEACGPWRSYSGVLELLKVLEEVLDEQPSPTGRLYGMEPGMTTPSKSEFLQLPRPEGAVAYEVSGTGPLIVCVPGMGDLRTSYRFLKAELLGAGFRVAVMDLRGHGDSDHGFSKYGDTPTAGDLEALVEELGGPAILVGNSMAAGSAVLVAAYRPELVRGLVLLGPFVRGPATSAMARWATRILMARPWAARSWNLYLPKLYAGTRPDDFAQYRAAVSAAMKRPGYAKAFSLTTRNRHDAAEQALPLVTAPALIVMGEQDPDFPDPAVEARWITDQLRGEVLMVPQAGHYPQSQRADVVGPAVTKFARGLHAARATGNQHH
jgi:pimeloyl-ACP methyl ester carboxylesterase